MILSIRERKNIKETYEIVGEANSSIRYQIKKIKHLCKEIETELDKPRNTFYINSISFDYSIDFLINGFSVLIEYYHTWVLQQRIGLLYPKVKISYKAIKKNDIKAIDKLLRSYKAGITNSPELYSFNFYEKCRSLYISAMENFFTGKNHEIFVLNNYIKHNSIMRSYAPLTVLDNNYFSFPYLYIHESHVDLLNNSLLRSLFKITVDDMDGRIDNEHYNGKIELYKIGSLDILEANGLEYVKCSSYVGVSIESILETIKNACTSILDLMLEEIRSNGISGGSCIDDLTSLKSEFTDRRAKTLYNKINKNH
ncbi:hypothetical protein [Pseudomonas sp. MYb185]|uniref:hypothetical protein n=1 Tax=Pseudomonas sp. MYb185 TaxID=1848729 RepID=UPI0011B02CA8|nr:hypothetical protein [Pseudomonas sp. MYb185]